MKMIVLILSFILMCIVFAQVVSAQSNPQVLQSLNSIQNTVMKLMQFYDSYDDGSPESLKKARYNKAADEISGGTATQSDKDQAYQIIDAYIKGDKALEQNFDVQELTEEDFDEYIENTDKAKAAINYLNQQKGMLQKMSYSEFEDFVEKASPVANKSDIKKSYNEIHKTDGKQVSITAGDEEMTEAQKQMWALDILNNPKNYEDFKKACRILDINMPESKIRNAWDSRNH